MPRLQDRLSLRVISLTVILAIITAYIGISGLYALDDLNEEYHDVKNENLEVLLDVIELKIQVNDVLNTTWSLFLAEDKQELTSLISHISDKEVWIDKSLTAIYNKSENTQELMDVKQRLYQQTEVVSAALQKKIELSNQLFTQYEALENYKLLQEQKGATDVVLMIERIMNIVVPAALHQPIVKTQSVTSKVRLLVNARENKMSKQSFDDLTALFFGPASLIPVYQDYINQLTVLKSLKAENASVNASVVSIISKKDINVQKELLTHLHLIEGKISSREYRLYLLLFTSFIFTLILVFLQIDFLRRIHVIRKVISAGDNKTKFHLPIKGKDEITEMAKSVKSYIDTLLEKEQEVSENNEKLKHLASHDSLTNIYNRRYFDTSFVQEHIRYLRYKESYCLAILDLDFFKNINDNYGHDVGDKVLIDFTARVANQMRETDIFARLGGEEFALLMPRTSEGNATILMERIRNDINSTTYINDDVEIKYTVSIGLVEVKDIEGTQDATKQLKFADKALYEAKQTGRNRVCVYHGE